MIKLTDNLLGLCNHPVAPRQNYLNIKQDFRQLQRMTPLEVIIPLQAAMTPTLPSSPVVDTANYDVFPNSIPTIFRTFSPWLISVFISRYLTFLINN